MTNTTRDDDRMWSTNIGDANIKEGSRTRCSYIVWS